jgi:2-oxoglutarate dehydrogenase E2 component (dihydrolipoamide succinyltransferase)
MGDSISEGQVVEIAKRIGDSVRVDEVVAVLETDKVSVDVTSPSAGTVTEIHVNTGDVVKIDASILTLDDQTTTHSVSASPSSAPQQAQEPEDDQHYQPSIKFRYGKGIKAELPKDHLQSQKKNEIPSKAAIIFSDLDQLPLKYRFRPVSDWEQEAVNSGGASLLDS